MTNPFIGLKSITPTEMANLKKVSSGLSEEQLRNFVSVYSSKRREPELLLIIACAGFFGVAGIQRVLVGQIGMGILFSLPAVFVPSERFSISSITSSWRMNTMRKWQMKHCS